SRWQGRQRRLVSWSAYSSLLSPHRVRHVRGDAQGGSGVRGARWWTPLARLCHDERMVDRAKPPHEAARLTDEQRQILGEHIQNKWHNFHCPRCNENNWSIDQGVYHITATPPGTLMAGARTLPTGVVLCINCGHMEWVNLIVA